MKRKSYLLKCIQAQALKIIQWNDKESLTTNIRNLMVFIDFLYDENIIDIDEVFDQVLMKRQKDEIGFKVYQCMGNIENENSLQYKIGDEVTAYLDNPLKNEFDKVQVTGKILNIIDPKQKTYLLKIPNKKHFKTYHVIKEDCLTLPKIDIKKLSLFTWEQVDKDGGFKGC